MKYCVNYSSTSKYVADEVKIHLKNTTDLALLPLFADEHLDQRVIAVIDDPEDFVAEDRLAAIKEILNKRDYNNISFCYATGLFVNTPLNVLADYMKKYNQTFFFEKHITDWDILIGVLSLDVSDVYITDSMGFELDKIKEVTKAYNCQIRIFIDMCQSSFPPLNPIFSFWIRPEDIDFYSQYVDVIERWRPGDTTQDDTYYEIFMITKRWDGDLGEIIHGLEGCELDSRRFIPSWRRRATCGKRCLKGSPCRVCYFIEKLTKSLKDDNLIIKSI